MLYSSTLRHQVLNVGVSSPLKDPRGMILSDCSPATYQDIPTSSLTVTVEDHGFRALPDDPYV